MATCCFRMSASTPKTQSKGRRCGSEVTLQADREVSVSRQRAVRCVTKPAPVHQGPSHYTHRPRDRKGAKSLAPADRDRCFIPTHGLSRGRVHALGIDQNVKRPVGRRKHLPTWLRPLLSCLFSLLLPTSAWRPSWLPVRPGFAWSLPLPPR